MKRRTLRRSIDDRESYQNVFNVDLCILRKNIEVSVVIKNAAIKQFIFRLIFSASPVFINQSCVGIFKLRIFVEELHVGVSGSTVKIEVVFFDVLAVVPLIPREAIEALLQNRIAPVPQRQSKTNQLAPVANSR